MTNEIVCGETWCGCGKCDLKGELVYSREVGYLGPEFHPENDVDAV